MGQKRFQDQAFGSVFLIGGLITLSVFFIAPFSLSILELAEKLQQTNGFDQFSTVLLIFILAASLFSCYLGIQQLLNIPTSKALPVVLLILCLISQFSLLWFFSEIRSRSIIVSWSGFSICLFTNLIILLVACLDIYLFLVKKRVMLENPGAVDRKSTTIEEQIYQNYISQENKIWEFQPKQLGEVKEFHPVPYLPGRDDWLVQKRPWRIILDMCRTGYEEDLTIGLDLYGDIILGRSHNDEEGRITLDLSKYDTRRLGVTRHHVLIRPSSDAIYIIDMGSKNGTSINNDSSIPSHTATQVHDGDLINLGKVVSFRINIISQSTNQPSQSISDIPLA